MPSKSITPKSWPPNLPYLTSPVYSRTLKANHHTSLRTQTLSQIQITTSKAPSPLVKIIPITIQFHPANGQSGLFATVDLKPGTFILQYLGEIHDTPTEVENPHVNSDYDLSLDRDIGLGIDADSAGNEARFINDYRGVADRANAEFKEIWDVKRGEKGIGVFVLPEGKKLKMKGVKKGEEILVSYGRGFWNARMEGVDV